MLLSKKWLNHFVDVSDISAQELAETLTNAGLEVEGISQPIPATNLVIGQVVECEKHPDSDHLHITKVNIGNEVLDIVCGAPNVAVNQKVIVAKVGAVLPELVIQEAVVRGVPSNGMICSLLELGIDADLLAVDSPSHDGIEVLKEDAPIGGDPIVYLDLDDDILDVSLTPNRADFLAMASVGREVAALLKREFKNQPEESDVLDGLESSFSVSSTTENNSLFLAKVIGKVEVKPSPQWIQRALMSSGMNPINNLVDISNLVMLETGQPTHFYDRDFFKVDDITVIDDYEGEVVALDEQVYKIEKGDTIISQKGEPIGIGGIKGLGNSMITENTKAMVIEIASFDPIAVRNTSKRLNLTSDAQLRYIRPMDPQAPIKALKRIMYLLKEYANIDDVYETKIYGELKEDKLPQVSVTHQHVNDLLGTNLSLEAIVDVFERLNFNPTHDHETIVCTIPSYRRDLFIAEDLIEEVIRVVGYDIIESTLPQMPLTLGSLDEKQRLIRTVEESLVGWGAQQIISYTLVSQAMTDHPQGLEKPMKLQSPLSEHRRYIRNNVTTSIIKTLQYNLDHNNTDNLYFEISQVYGESTDSWRLGIIGQGELVSSQYNNQSQMLDYYRLKGLIEGVFSDLGIHVSRLRYETNDIDDDNYHPYRSAKLYLDDEMIGLLGETHPTLEFENGVLCELDLSVVMSVNKVKTKYVSLNKYPRVHRDLAIVVKNEIDHEAISNVIAGNGTTNLKHFYLFDIYPLNDHKSMAYHLVFENNERTLQEEDITTTISKIMKALETELGASLR